MSLKMSESHFPRKKYLNCEETGKEHDFKISGGAATLVHVVSANVPGDSFLLKLRLSHRISAWVNVEGGGTIGYQGGILTQIPQGRRQCSFLLFQLSLLRLP